MTSLVAKAKQILKSLFSTIVIIVVTWALIGASLYGFSIDAVQGIVHGHFYCDRKCQDKIFHNDYPRVDKDVVVYASRNVLVCQYLTPYGWFVRNYWWGDWMYMTVEDYVATDADKLPHLSSLPGITRDWESYLPMRVLSNVIECPERLDGRLSKADWEKPEEPDGFHFEVYDKKYWTDAIYTW